MAHRPARRTWHHLSRAEREQRLADMRERQQLQISTEIRRLAHHV